MKTHNQKVQKKPSHRLFHEPSSSSIAVSNGDTNPLNHTSQEKQVEVAGTITNHLDSTQDASSLVTEIDPLLEIDTEVPNTLRI